MTTDHRGLLAVSAQASLDDRGRLVHEDDPAAQLALALVHVEAQLARAGLRPDDLVEIEALTPDPDRLRSVLDVLTDRLADTGAAPTIHLRQVRDLPVPGLVVALTALADPTRSHTPNKELS